MRSGQTPGGPALSCLLRLHHLTVRRTITPQTFWSQPLTLRASIFRLLLVLPLFAAQWLGAQEVPPLILEDDSSIKATTRKKEDPKPSQKQESAEPTPRPEDVLIALVNSRVLTRAELNYRVSQDFERIKAEVQSRVGGVVATSDSVADTGEAAKENDEVLVEQQDQIDEAMRKEESVAVQRWVEHSLLADEARRQGIAVSDSDFRNRLAEAERANRLDATEIQTALDRLHVSRADYERGVYDALMIQALLDRFIDLNYTEADFRRAYDRAPQLYYTPRKFLLAHFTVALDGTESKAQLASLRKEAEAVRDRLKRGDDAGKLFDDSTFNRPAEGVFGSVPGYYSFMEGTLPKIVEYEGKKMKLGETSDVLVAQKREDGKIVPISYHVIKLLEERPEEGRTFESALPAIRRGMLEIARNQLMEMLRRAKTHRVVTNLSGIASSRLPTREELMKLERQAQPVSLKFDRNAPPPALEPEEEEEPEPSKTPVPVTVKQKKPSPKRSLKLDPALIPTPLP